MSSAQRSLGAPFASVSLGPVGGWPATISKLFSTASRALALGASPAKTRPPAPSTPAENR